MRIYATQLLLALLVCPFHHSVGQQPPPLSAFDGVVAFTGYPNGMLFHTAFHGNNSTRFLLIKAIASNDSLAKDFRLNESQIAAINELLPIETAKTNDSPDELIVDPQLYSMLTLQQVDWLTFLTLRFDGLPGLTHKSVADRVGISQTTLEKMRKIVARNRDSIVLPNFRVRFASNRSEQDKARDADFDTRLLVMTNFQLVTTLTDNERDNLAGFMKTHEIANIVRQIEAMAPLPNGLAHLHELVKDDSGRTKIEMNLSRRACPIC